MSKSSWSHRAWRAWVVGLVLALGAVVVPSSAPSASADVVPGDDLWVGQGVGYGGTSMHAIYREQPADPQNPGTPDYWAYCVEHDISAQPHREGEVTDPSGYLGDNHFNDPAVQAKVLWVLAHSYPYLSLTDFAAAVGLPSISENDAIEATQYAIWRYTDLTFDAPWPWETSDSEDAYWYLVNGANASSGTTTFPSVTATVTAPVSAQQAGTLVGPFTVDTNQPTVGVSGPSGVAVTDASGTPISTSAVTDGQQLYLDLRGSTTAGSATVTVTAQGAGGSGNIITVPTTPGGTPTSDAHGQTMILIAPSTATTTDSATVSWAAAPTPSIGTTLTDKGDGDHTIPAGGGIVVDTIAYQNLTPGTSYTVTGELRRRSDGSATGITGSTTFTPTQFSGTVAVELTVPAGYAGQQLVAFEELTITGQATVVAEHKDINDAAQTVSVAPETGSGGQSKVSLTTETSHDQAKPGTQISDKVTITGFVPGHGATGSATLYGPFASRDEIACTPAHAVGTVAFAPANGAVRTPTVQVNRTGYYTWVASTMADSRNTAATHACGLASETTIVRKPSYPTPVVGTGFSTDGWDGAGRRKVDRIRIPSIGVDARTSLVGIKKGSMQVPGNVARTGQLAQSAAAGDLIGTTVIAGHVSDRRDRPGAFWKLTKLRKGKVVTVRQGGTRLRYRVTSVERFSRTQKLPERFFSTTGEHQLVLISCAGRTTTSNGGFHYRQNVVVTAVPIG